MNELEQLLAMLGVQTFAQAAASISTFSSFLDSAKSMTGKDKADEALSELQARAQRSPFAQAVEKATGKTGDEAIGLLHAALASHAELPNARASLAALEKTTNAQAFEQLVIKTKGENKLTKAQEDNFRAAFTSGDLTLKQAEFVFTNLTVIAALEHKEPAAPTSVITPSPELKHEGKSWGEMKPSARASLKKSDPALYEAMRQGAGL